MRNLIVLIFIFISSTVLPDEIQFLPSSFKLEFEQHYKSQLTNKMKVNKGVMDYAYPSNIKFETVEPKESQSIFVSNGKKTWLYTPPFVESEKGEVVYNPQGRHMLAKFFDSLKKGLVNNELYTIEREGDLVTLVFRKSVVKQLKIQKAIFTFAVGGGEIQQLSQAREMKLIFDDGKTNSFVFSKFTPSVSYTPQFFDFVVPPNTNVVE